MMTLGRKFLVAGTLLFVGLVGCGDGKTADPRLAEWSPQPVDPGIVPKPVDVTLPLPSAPTPAVYELIITSKALFFTPSPLYAIFIYEGTYTSYDEAIVTANPVASVPALQSCTSTDGRCWRSPLPLSHCKSCGSLDPKKTYTAFLLRKTSEPLEDVLAIPVHF